MAFSRLGLLAALSWALLPCVLVSPGIGATPPRIPLQPVPTPAKQLRRLSLEELLAMDVTTVSRHPEQLFAAASAVGVVTGEEIRRSGATTLADALRFSTGLEVARIDGRTWGVAARGFNANAANKLLVMLDGRSLYTPLFSGVFWDVQDTEFADIERIEVVRGPGATMWGANAVNGVVSVHTKPARETLGTLITAGGGNEERTFGSMRHGLTVGKGIHARVYAKQYQRDDLVFADGTDARDHTRMWQGGFRADVEREGDPNALTLQGDIYHGFLGAVTGPDSRVAGGNVLGRWQHAFDRASTLQVQTYYDRVERFVPGQFGEWRDSLDFDAQFHTAVGKRHQLSSGVTARASEDRTRTTGTVRFSPPRRRITVVGGFLQDEVTLMDEALNVTVGAKFETNNFTGWELQPSLRGAWRPDPRQTAWTAISRAVRTPSRFDDDLRFVLPNGVTFVRGDPAFRSEVLTAYEAGYRVHFRQGWAFDFSVYSNHYHRLRSQERAVEPGVLFVLRNQLKGETYGAEVGFTAQVLKNWRIRGMLGQLRKKLTLEPGSTDVTGGAQEGNDPEFQWTLVSSWDFGGKWEFDALLRQVSALPNPSVPAYTELDLHLGWQPTAKWELALIVQNALEPSHREFGAAGPIARELQRSAYGRVTWRF